MAGEYTPEEDATLRRLWPTTTATELGRRLHRTRNQIIGRVHRLGLRKGGSVHGEPCVAAAPAIKPTTDAPVRQTASAPAATAARPGPAAAPERIASAVVRLIAPAAPATPRSVPESVAALCGGQCRYPIGDPIVPDPAAPFRFCCAPPVADGKPYCAVHADLCFAGTYRVPSAHRTVGAVKGGAWA